MNNRNLSLKTFLLSKVFLFLYCLVNIFLFPWQSVTQEVGSGKPNASAPAELSMLVPAYFYPDEEGMVKWERLFQTSAILPTVAIINPDNGVGQTPDPNYLQVTALAAEYPITLIGYVYTSYGQRPLQQVKSEIDRWIDFYPGLQGIFLDEQASGREKASYYRQLYQYVRTTLDLSLVVSNPGTICAEAYFTQRVADIICLYEGPETIDDVSFPTWTDQYPNVEVALLPYEVNFSQSIDRIGPDLHRFICQSFD